MKLDSTEITKLLLEKASVEYGLFDAGGLLQFCSPGFGDYVSNDPVVAGLADAAGTTGEQLQGLSPIELFYELIGYEDVLEAIRSGKQAELRLERIYRENFRGREAYITLRLSPYSDGLLLMVSESTEMCLLEQRITQQRNDLLLLARRLEQTRFRLDDLLHRFVPGAVADRLLENRQQVLPGGVLREVTVMFADLRGFSNWASSREPQIILTTLNSIFDEALEVLLDQGATVDKFIGDAIMAFFNAPGDQPDHAQRALDCARRIRDMPAVAHPSLRFGIGINSGLVVAGNLGTARTMQYTVLGDAVNIAKRLEERAGPGDVLLGPGFVELLEGDWPVARHGNLCLKGRADELTIYRLER